MRMTAADENEVGPDLLLLLWRWPHRLRRAYPTPVLLPSRGSFSLAYPPRIRVYRKAMHPAVHEVLCTFSPSVPVVVVVVVCVAEAIVP